MANDRMWIKCSVCNEVYLLAKSFGADWHTWNDNFEESLNTFLEEHTWCDHRDFRDSGSPGQPFVLTYEADPVKPTTVPATVSELKACPFCGTSGRVGVNFLASNPPKDFRAGCSLCMIMTPGHKTREEAVAVWNARPTPIQGD